MERRAGEAGPGGTPYILSLLLPPIQPPRPPQNRLAALARESREQGQAQTPGLPTSKSAPASMGQATPPTPSTAPPPAKRARPDETPRKYTILKREGPSTDPQIRRRMPTAPCVPSFLPRC